MIEGSQTGRHTRDAPDVVTADFQKPDQARAVSFNSVVIGLEVTLVAGDNETTLTGLGVC